MWLKSARILRHQIPDLLSMEIISSYQGNLHEAKRNQFYRSNVCRNSFSLLLATCLVMHSFGVAHANNTEVMKNDNMTKWHMTVNGKYGIGNYTTINDTFNLMQDGEKLLRLDENRNAILVLGNTGSGKTTLTQFIAGDNSKLHSVEVEAETGDYIIKDENDQIGHGIQSRTLIPERVLDATTGLVYYDCPGFSQTRNAAFDISATYFLKKTVDHLKSVKLILTISYSSVRIGVDQYDFMKLLRHTNEFIKDIEKFNDSVALVVTKVDNQYIVKNKKVILVSDAKTTDRIAKYIQQAREDLQKSLRIERNQREVGFYEKSIFLMDIFLRKKHGKYVNIALFRRPDTEGLISDIELLQDRKKYIRNLTENNIMFIKKMKDDFGFTVSDNSKVNIIKLVDKINEHMLTNISSASLEIEDAVDLRAGSGNFYKAKEEMSLVYEKLIKKREELKKSASRREFVQKFIDFINSLNVKNSRRIYLDILKKYNYLEFLEQVSHENYEVQSRKWAKPLRSIIEYARQSKIWYSFLTDLYEKFPLYEMYTDFYDKVISKTANNIPTIKFLDINEFLRSLKGYEVKYYEEVIEQDLDLRKQQEVNVILKSVYGYIGTSKCLDDALIVKGDFIKFSDINFINSCSKPIKTIKLFASNTVFIDDDLIKTGDKINIFMLAPRWEVIGTRKIILDGARQESDFQFSTAPRGQNGKPGLPGGTAGNFVGVGNEIINAEKLTISANGGNGGNGQNGGDGLPGINGNIRIPDEEMSLENGIKYMAVEGFVLIHKKEVSLSQFCATIVLVYRYFLANGTKGTAGQDGGMGGAGGKGGLKGKVLIYGLNNAKVSVLSENGSEGRAGAGGVGGKGGRHGATCRMIHESIKDSKRRPPHSEWTTHYCNDGGWASNGRTNTNIFYTGIKNPDDINTFTIHYLVSKYKSYLLSNIKNSIKDNLLIKFYSQLSNDSAIEDSYDSIALCHELKILEKHFHSLHKIIKMQDLYNSLIKRIENYSKSPKGYEVSLSHKKLLNFLHAAVLSKTMSLGNDSRYDLVVDVNSFFTLIISNMEKIQHNAKQTAIAELNKNYKKKIDDKIEEADSFIKKLIIPNLEEDEQRIGFEFDKLIDEILTMQNNAETKKGELIQKQKELENSMRTKGLFGVLEIFAVGAQFFGPIGNIVCKGIQVATQVTNSISNNDPAIPELSLSVPDEVVENLNEKMTFLEDFVGKKASALSKVMDRILKETQKYPNELQDISTVVSDLKSTLTNAEENQKHLNLSLITSMKDQLTEVLTNKIKSIHSNSSEASKRSKSVNKISNSLDVLVGEVYVTDVFADDYIKYQEHEEKMTQIQNAILNQELAVDALRKHQIFMYQTVFPLMEKIREAVFMLTNGTSSNSVVMMNILHREITRSLKDIKMILRKLTNGFKVQDSIQHYLDKMEETLTFFLKIYEKLDKYNEAKELADYIADINSADANQITTDNATINTALNELDVMIDYNIVIEQCQKAIFSFKQFVFPFSSYYSEELDFHNKVTVKSNLENLVSSANYQIKKLKSKLTEHNLSVVGPIDMYIYEEYFQTGKAYSAPFFVWDGDQYEGTISKLLSGKKIVLKSDILTSVHEKNAIKFNKIEINFNSADKELLHDLKRRLKQFDVKMKHSGSSYYRCDNKFYLIKSDSQTLYYSFEKDAQGEPVRKNNVYTKIKNGQYMLSPYTVWTIQLKHVKNFPFDALQKFIGKVDLELVGHGQFVSTESSICSTDLKQFYEPFNNLSVTDILYEKV